MLNKTERKILFYNKLKLGMSKKEAYKAVARDIKVVKENAIKFNKEKPIKKDFNTEFKELIKK